MTYRELAQLIMEELSDDQLDMNVSVYDWDQDRFYPLAHTPLAITSDEDELDPDHPYLII